MDYIKYADIIHETEDAYIATIWTGPNYYIGWFPKAELDAEIEYAAECGVSVSLEKAIVRTSVADMHFMCKAEDYSEEVAQAWIEHFLPIDEMEAEA